MEMEMQRDVTFEIRWIERSGGKSPFFASKETKAT